MRTEILVAGDRKELWIEKKTTVELILGECSD